ncbi:MAG: TadE family protein [Bryobacteraceae bacterium]|jgi:Flp pilus assembly protein TadG
MVSSSDSSRFAREPGARTITASLALAGSRRSGQAVIEVSLLVPWIVFAFVAAFNFGIFAYALISTENAARSAALYASQSLAVAQSGSVVAQVCPYVLGELGDAPGVGSGVTTCTSTPVTVTVTANTPGAGDMNTVKVSVTYNTMQLIPLPGLMAGSLAITRTVEAPIRN